jgi:hypothetical protein
MKSPQPVPFLPAPPQKRPPHEYVGAEYSDAHQNREHEQASGRSESFPRPRLLFCAQLALKRGERQRVTTENPETVERPIKLFRHSNRDFAASRTCAEKNRLPTVSPATYPLIGKVFLLGLWKFP